MKQRGMAGRERERQSNLQMHLLDAPNEICLSWRGACSRKKKRAGARMCSAFFLSGFLAPSLPLRLIVPEIWPIHQYVFRPVSH